MRFFSFELQMNKQISKKPNYKEVDSSLAVSYILQNLNLVSRDSFPIKDELSGLRQFLATESP